MIKKERIFIFVLGALVALAAAVLISRSPKFMRQAIDKAGMTGNTVTYDSYGIMVAEQEFIPVYPYLETLSVVLELSEADASDTVRVTLYDAAHTVCALCERPIAELNSGEWLAFSMEVGVTPGATYYFTVEGTEGPGVKAFYRNLMLDRISENVALTYAGEPMEGYGLVAGYTYRLPSGKTLIALCAAFFFFFILASISALEGCRKCTSRE